MKTSSKIISFIFLIVLITSCKSAKLNERKEITLTRNDGKVVKCFQPPADVTVTGTDLNFSAIKNHINAIASVNTKITLIREEIPGINSIEAIEFRMCNAYGNNIIDSETYDKFVGQILPALEIINQPTISNNNIGENYMRLFGALEAPIIMRLITGKSDGYELIGDVISSSSIDESTGEKIEGIAESGYTLGHIDKPIVDFWKNKWEYSKILPLNTSLWKSIIDDPYNDMNLFWTASITDESGFVFNERRNAWCVIDDLFPWEVPSHIEEWIINSDSGKNLCNKEVSQDIGFLYLILENFSENRLDDIELFYKNLPNESAELLRMPDNYHYEKSFEEGIVKITRTEYIENIGLAKEKEEALLSTEEQKLFLPKMLPNQSFIWILSVYFKDEKGYPKSYLSDITKPLKVKYKINGKEYTEIIREPGKDKSIKINLPFGWYGQ